MFLEGVCEKATEIKTHISYVLFKDVGAAEEKTNDKPASEDRSRTGG